jgi:hydrogenase-4 component B
MAPIQLLLSAVFLYGAAAVLSLLFKFSSRAARFVSGILGMIASAIGCLAATEVFLFGPAKLVLTGTPAFGDLVLNVDHFSAFMVGTISILAFATSLYSISYVEKYDDSGAAQLGFFNNLFIAAMLLVVSVANAFYFLIFWESMTLASYFLVIFEQEKKESVQAGYLYILIAHIGTALIMLAFFVLYKNTGTFEFSSFREASLPLATRNLVFVLALLGFGAKAGIVPLHIWLPRAHPAAPSHVSALLSGVMIKTAVYGIVRLGVDLLGAPVSWWGFVVLLFGMLSAILGIAYALDERDLKRLLAYSSVENIGIILMGIGIGMVGMAAGLPALALLGFLAALYHLINHAVFKGLLFMGAGAVIHRTHTNNMNEMGGLGRLMPWTSLVFLIGAISISAIPPLNGFVSEWFLYQSLFVGSRANLGVLKVFGPLSVMLLALVGAMVAMCFVKAYGTTFMGPPRSKRARETTEVPGSMLAGMGILTLGAVFLGIAAPIVVPFIARIAAGLAGVPEALLTNGIQVFPIVGSQTMLSSPLILVLLAGLLSVPLLAVWLLGGFAAGRRTETDPWACGYGYSPLMGISASNFAQPMRLAYRPLFMLRSLIQKPLDGFAVLSKDVNRGLPEAEPLIERAISRPILSTVQYVGRRVQSLHMGDVRIYCLYIFVALAVLLIAIFR